MVTITRGGGSGSSSGSSSGSGTKPIYERLCELIAAKVTPRILDGTPMMNGAIKEGIMEIMDKPHSAFLPRILQV